MYCGVGVLVIVNGRSTTAAVTPTVSEMTYNVSSGTLNHTQPTDGTDEVEINRLTDIVAQLTAVLNKALIGELVTMCAMKHV